MIKSAVFIALIGTLHLKPAISAAISYEPIKITVNENFNAQPGQVSTGFQSLEPGVVHQGANFYFKPRFNLPTSSISHHIEALMSLIPQHSCAKDASKVVFEKDKLMKILTPFLYPKKVLSDTVMKEENNSEIVEPVPILITEESKPTIPELEVIPEAPVLPPLSFDGIPPIVEEEVKKKESVILEESTSVLNEVPPKPAPLELVILPEAPVLPPLSASDIHIIEEVKVEEPMTLTRQEPIVVDVEPKSATHNLLVIPEAPVLPALPFNGMPSIVEEEVKKEKSVILEELTDIFPTKPAITVGPITEPIITYEDPKTSTSGLLVIPEAPVLPSLSFNGMPPFVEKKVKKEKSIILEKSTGEPKEPTTIEVEPKPATPERVIITEAPILPTLSANDIRIVEKVNIEEPKTSELVVIPEAPVLPLLSFDDIPSFVEEELKKKESIILEQQTDVFPKIPEITVGPITEPIINYVEPKPNTSELLVISEAPVLPPLSFNDIRTFFEDEMKKKESIILEKSTGVFQEPTITQIELKTATPEHEVIPEALVLPPLSINRIPASVEKEVKKEESIILEESTGESEEPTIIEVEPKPATPEFVVIPEAPVLPPFSVNDNHIVEEVKIEEPISLPMLESIDVNIEPTKPGTPELQVIPEAPILPPLSFNSIPAFVEEEVKKEESVILEDSTGVLPEPTTIKVKPKPTTPEFVIIPGKLQSLSFEDIRTFVEEEMKNKESIILEESTTEPQEPTIIEIEPKPATPELEVIPEAPVLPPLSINSKPASVEKEMKKEESIILKESTGESQEPTIIEVEPKPATPEFVVIPEAPVLPPFSVNDNHIVEEVKIEELISLPMLESIDVNIEPTKPGTPELPVIPEAPILPPLSFNSIPAFVEEEVKKEESVILEESTGVLPEPTTIEVKPKPATPEFVIIPGKLQSLSFEDIRTFVEEEMKNKESIILEESTSESQEPTIIEIEPKPATPELEVIPEAPVLPPPSINSIPASVEKEMKKEESIILKESTGESQEPTIIEVEPKPATPEFVVISEAPVLPPFSVNDNHIVEEVEIEEPISLPSMVESIDVDIEPKLGTPGLQVIPEAPMLPPLSFNGFSSAVEEEVKKEESVTLEQSTGVLQEPTIIEVEPRPTTPELVEIPETLVLPPMSEMHVLKDSDESIILDESTGSILEISARPTLESFVETETAKSFALENNIFPVATEEVKIEIPLLLEESIEVFPAIGGISSGPTLQEPEITDSFVLEEVSQTNPEPVVGVRETLPPTIIRKPSNNLGLLSYAPFLSHLSNRAPKSKKVMFPKPASLERFLLKKHPISLPVTPFPKLSLNAIKSPILENKKQFLYPTSYAHDVVEKSFSPNMALKRMLLLNA